MIINLKRLLDMVQYSTIFRPLFLIGIGLVYALAAFGAGVWAQDLGLVMNWWKWLLVIIWYALLNITFAIGFTLVGEKEPGAGVRFLRIFPPLLFLLGIGMRALLWYV